MELISPVCFLRRYYEATRPFTSPSYRCARRSALVKAGPEPFKVHGADDSYLFTLTPLFGWSVVYNPMPLAACRIVPRSLSANTLWIIGQLVQVFETLAERYAQADNSGLRREFEREFAMRTREYAKLLVNAGRILEARSQLASSVSIAKNPVSIAKSLVLLLLTQLPGPLRSTLARRSRRATVKGQE